MSTTMPAAVWTATDTIELHDLDVPRPPEGWALVEVAYTGICGTDLSILHGKHPRARHGQVLGHEISGRVVQEAPTGPRAGSAVVVEPLISCGRCGACRRGDTHVCRELGLYGIDRPGSLARYVALPAEVLHGVPDGVDLRLATLVEPLAVAVHAVAMSGLREGDTVAVAGAGPIGILTALVARHAGAAHVVISEPSPVRRDLAERLGLTVVPADGTLTGTVLGLTDGDGADVVFDAAGHPAVLPDLTAAARVGGTVMVVAVHKEPGPVDLREVSFKELVVRGVRVYTTDDVRRAIELVADGSLGLDRLPTRAFRLEDTSQAFAAAGAADHLKVLVASHDEDADA
ncbi:MAG TPA: alcohol dehydrogenase catalytic domain-containing protein [Promicromonospora sp.]|nr:alcohol dehydrogenase catalytic domain-containing protein [Promicromonospora sp.]